MKQQNETQLTKVVRKYLFGLGIWNFKHWSGPFSRKGVSDLLCVKPVMITEDMVGQTLGVFTAIEMKTPGWKAPNKGTKAYKHYKEQKDFIKEVTDSHGYGFFANSVDQVIDRLGYRDRFLF